MARSLWLGLWAGLPSHVPGLPAQPRVQTGIALPCLPTLQEGQTATTQPVVTQEMDPPNLLRLRYTLETGIQRSFLLSDFLLFMRSSCA